MAILLGDPRHPVPLGYDPHTRAAAAVLRYRMDNLYAPHLAARGPRLVITTVPWDAAIVSSRSVEYRPVLESVEPSVTLQDDCQLAAAFRDYSDPSELYQEDYHISDKGAAVVSESLLPYIIRIHNSASKK
jgi:hypothetical protein